MGAREELGEIVPSVKKRPVGQRSTSAVSASDARTDITIVAMLRLMGKTMAYGGSQARMERSGSSVRASVTRRERSEMKKFRKRPMVVDAIQVVQENLEALEAIEEEYRKTKTPIRVQRDDDRETLQFVDVWPIDSNTCRMKLGCWLIRGVQGELYPCKEDIFDQSYDPEE